MTHGYQQLGSINHDSSLIKDMCVKSSIQYRMLTGILGVIVDTRKKPRMKMPVPAKKRGTRLECWLHDESIYSEDKNGALAVPFS
jgi:hypothetical protein